MATIVGKSVNSLLYARLI